MVHPKDPLVFKPIKPPIEAVTILNGLKGRNLLSISDLNEKEIYATLDTASELKKKLSGGIAHNYLPGKTIGMIFEKPSTRTKISFENGIFHLGAMPSYLDFSKNSTLQTSRGESFEHTIGTLSRFYDALVCRLYSHDTLKKIPAIIKNASPGKIVPVINALTDLEHPCQILADLMTIQEHKGALKGLMLAYFGDANNNVTNSLVLAAAIVGMNIRIACPNDVRYSLPYQIRAEAIGISEKSHNSKIAVMNDPKDAARKADIIYTDTWVSMGCESEKEARRKAFASYQVTKEIMALAKPNAIFMHDMPAYVGYEVTAEVIDGPQSVIFDQAENRMHAQKALLTGILG